MPEPTIKAKIQLVGDGGGAAIGGNGKSDEEKKTEHKANKTIVDKLPKLAGRFGAIGAFAAAMIAIVPVFAGLVQKVLGPVPDKTFLDLESKNPFTHLKRMFEGKGLEELGTDTDNINNALERQQDVLNLLEQAKRGDQEATEKLREEYFASDIMAAVLNEQLGLMAPNLQEVTENMKQQLGPTKEAADAMMRYADAIDRVQRALQRTRSLNSSEVGYAQLVAARARQTGFDSAKFLQNILALQPERRQQLSEAGLI